MLAISLRTIAQMEFWLLTSPNYKSDYEYEYINGSLEHPFGLPGVICDVCGATWGGGRVLPIDCPATLRDRELLHNRWPIGLTQYRNLQREVEEEFIKIGVSIGKLQPGDEFQPAYLDIPSKPQSDFLWSHLGTIVVSLRIRQVFEALNIQDVAFSEVKFRKVGANPPKLPPPMPSTGEPEDIIGEVPLLTRTDTINPYYELVILSKSGYPPGGQPLSICTGCGRETIDHNTRQLVMLPSMWTGTDIFFMATTLYIVITERVKRRLTEVRATNADYVKLHAHKPV